MQEYTEPTPISAGRHSPGALKAATSSGWHRPAPATPPHLRSRSYIALLGGPRRTRVLVLTPTREFGRAGPRPVSRKYAKHAGRVRDPVYGGVPLEAQERALRAGVDVRRGDARTAARPPWTGNLQRRQLRSAFEVPGARRSRPHARHRDSRPRSNRIVQQLRRLRPPDAALSATMPG